MENRGVLAGGRTGHRLMLTLGAAPPEVKLIMTSGTRALRPVIGGTQDGVKRYNSIKQDQQRSQTRILGGDPGDC